MRFLVDMPLSPGLVEFLTELGHDAVHASDMGLAMAPDVQIMERARAEGRVVVTADLDFPQLLALSGASGPGIILFRGGTYSEAETRHLMHRVLRSEQVERLGAAITVVESERIRVTRLPIVRNE